MNIKRNYISAISGKTVTWILFVLLFSLTTLSSCRDDRMDPEPNPPDPNELTSDVLFEINLPESATPSTYALTPENEDEIKTVEILLFEIKEGKKTYTGKPYYCNNILNGASSKEKYFIVSLPKGGPYDIVVLTNSRTAVKEQIVDVSVPKGTEKAALLKLLTFNHETKWVSDITSTDPKYIPIPMWGEIEAAEITWNLKFKTRLMRMLAKIDVEISTDATSSFTLQEIYLANPNTDGHIIPTHFHPNGKIKAPTLTGLPPKISNIVYASSEATGPGVAFKNVIYTFEANKADATSSANWSKSTCLILKGIYKADGVEYFYRVDFGNSATGNPEYLDILRNMKYSVKITRISTPGHATYADALASPSSNIASETLVWDHSELPIIVFDNNYTLGFSSDDITMSFHAGTTNQMKIRTDYPDGWKVDKIVFDMPAWLSVTANGVANVTADVAFTTTENNAASSRVCYIHFSAGDLKHIVKVTQMKAFRMDQVKWENYVGADFDSIAIKDELGVIYTSKVNPSGVLVADNGTTLKPMRFGALIAEVKAKYKKYWLTVPTANYFHNYDTRILTILDRSLIGLPIHLDKIRDSLAGSYIQVDYIDLAGYTNTSGVTDNWMPIGTESAPFTGNYKGTLDKVTKVYYNIKNLEINRPGMDYVGLFGYCSNDSFLNLILIESGSIRGRSYVGAIGGQIGKIQSSNSRASVEAVSDYVGGIAGSITNVAGGIFFYFNATNPINTIKGGGNYIGGICGINTGEIEGSSANADQGSANKTISGSGTNVGGVCGINKGKIINCSPKLLEIKGVTNVGGIAGSNSGIINLCKNNGNITGSGATSANVGGIVGLNENGAKITNASNDGKIVGIESVGGICGSNDSPIKAEKLTNNGRIVGERYVGGIIGRSINGGTIENCINDIDGVIAGGEHVGGICGASDNAISRCSNAASVTSTIVDGYVGGIAGSAAAITNCINTGSITNPRGKNSGGICGRGSVTFAPISYCYNIGPISNGGVVIAGYNVSRSSCYFSEAAGNFINTQGSTKFTKDDWPTRGMIGWGVYDEVSNPTGPWSTLGMWEGSSQSPSSYPLLKH